MTTYIDSPAIPAGRSSFPFTPLPVSDFIPGLFALWSLPLSAFQIWAHGWSTLVTQPEPEEDRHNPPSQLPVPNPLQQSKDRELFA